MQNNILLCRSLGFKLNCIVLFTLVLKKIILVNILPGSLYSEGIGPKTMVYEITKPGSFLSVKWK